MSLLDFLLHVKPDINFMLPTKWLEGLLYNPLILFSDPKL